jgi:hypothetical protein
VGKSRRLPDKKILSDCSVHTRENSAWNEPKSKALPYRWIFHLNKTSKESQAGAPDQSTGAKEQSSAPPASGAASDTKPMGEMKPSSGTMDTSQGAKEQSSAPPGSSASDPSKPNPTMGTEKE